MTEFTNSSNTLPPDTLNPNFVETLGDPQTELATALHPDSLRPQDSLDKTISSIHGLPFLSASEIGQTLKYPEGPVTSKVIENAKFPFSRIVGVRGFQSWAGRGLTSKGKIVEKGGGYSSATVIQHYVGKEPNPDYLPKIKVFKDADGAVWGYMDVDGAHRTAGAKARGDKALDCIVESDEYDRLPTSDLSIKEVILSQDKHRKRFLGGLVLKRQANRLVKASQKYDAEQAKRRQEMSKQVKNGWLNF